ncbi:MAG: hypothetical protein EON54_16490 [Alcaligenaceae bacterium]|nr:MAG: hypothetical protein EON54_16490 [Alcaligenaceae bacterium]
MAEARQSCDELLVMRYTFAIRVKWGRFDSALEMQELATLPTAKCRSLLEGHQVAGEQIDAFLKRRSQGYTGIFRQKSKEFIGYSLGEVSELAV